MVSSFPLPRCILNAAQNCQAEPNLLRLLTFYWYFVNRKASYIKSAFSIFTFYMSRCALKRLCYIIDKIIWQEFWQRRNSLPSFVLINRVKYTRINYIIFGVYERPCMLRNVVISSIISHFYCKVLSGSKLRRRHLP